MSQITAATVEARVRSQCGRIGLWIFLSTVTMLFAAFTSAFLVRRGGAGWEPIVLPAILWINTGVLVLSSGVLEVSRYLAGRPATRASGWWSLAALSLGGVFLAGQLAAWRELARSGVFLPSSPHSSFFYILTGLHGVHLWAGMILLAVLAWKSRRREEKLEVRRWADLCATYWHFMGVLWVYLFAVLSTG